MNGNCEQEPLQNTTKHEFENITCYEPTKLYDSIEANIRTPIFLFFPNGYSTGALRSTF